MFALNEFTNSKITNFNISFWSQEYIIKFNISMQDSFTMHILQPKNNLFKDKFSEVFL